jgi:hypothetical protein
MHNWFGRRGKLVRGLIIALALVFILLEWVTRLLAGAVHALIVGLGLTRFEAWMRGLPLWCVAPIVGIVAAGYIGLELGQFALIARHHYVLAGLSHVLKWLIFPILSYIWRLYDQRLLRYAWIRWVYRLYSDVHELIVGWVHSQEWYKSAVQFHRGYVDAGRNYFVALRAAYARRRAVLQRRNTLMNTARRLKRFRVRRS